MIGLAAAVLRHDRWVLAGAATALALGTGLVGTTALVMAALLTTPVPPAGPAATLADGDGVARTITLDAPDLGGVVTALSVGAVVTGAVTVAVTAGALTLRVALRRRTLALLRLAGAGPGRIRLLVVGEALALAVPAAVVGNVLAAVTAPAVRGALTSSGLVPIPVVPVDPLSVAGPVAAATAVIAVAAAYGAAARASRIRPAEALAEADLDRGVHTPGRLAVAGLLAVTGVVLTALAPGAGEESATPLAVFGPIALAAALALLAPGYLSRVAGALGALAAPFGSTAGWLAAAAARTGRRRAAAVAAPVLVGVAATGVVVSAVGSVAAATTADELARDRSALTVSADAGIDTGVLARIAATPGVRAVSAPVGVPVLTAFAGSVEQSDAIAVDLPALLATRDVTVVAGGTGPLAGDTVGISAEYAAMFDVRIGDRIPLGVFGGPSRTVTVVAVVDGGPSLPPVLLPASVRLPIRPQAPARASLALEPGGDRTAVAASLGALPGVRVVPAGADAGEQAAANRAVLVLLVGPGAVLALVAVALAQAMAHLGRDREVGTVRVAGGGRTHVLAAAAIEAALVALPALAVATVVVLAADAVHRAGLSAAYLATPSGLPWPALTALGAANLVVAVVSGVCGAARPLRRPVLTLVRETS